MIKTYNAIYLDIRKYLRDSGDESYDIDSKNICMAISGKNMADYIRDGRMYATEAMNAQAEEFARRRAIGEPLAYIVGNTDFYGLEFTVSRDVLIPRNDTEVLVETVIPKIQNMKEPARILDLCAGSGCIGISILTNIKSCKAVLIDNSPMAVNMCRKNARDNNVLNRAICMKIDVFDTNHIALGKFDALISNPPYIPRADLKTLDDSVKNYEPLAALDGGIDGLDFYREILKNWVEVIKPGGLIVFEIGINQADDVKKLMDAAGIENVEFVKDTLNIDRVVLGSKPL